MKINKKIQRNVNPVAKTPNSYCHLKSLTAGNLELSINTKNGNIAGIKDLKTNLVHTFPDAEKDSNDFLFRIITPTKEWTSRFAENKELIAQIEEKEDGIRFIYPELLAGEERTGIKAIVDITAVIERGEFLFTLTLENNGSEPVTEIVFPAVSGWESQGGKGKDRFIMGARASFDPYSFPLDRGMTYAGIHQKTSFAYPAGGVFVPWLDLSGPAGGISYINYMPKPRNGAFAIQNLPMHEEGFRIAFGWTHWPLVKPGEKWTSDPIGISLHGKDWHETADRYTKWASEWYKPLDTPKKAREAIGIQNVFLRGFDGTPFHDFESVPELARIGRKYGVDQLCIWDYQTLGGYVKQRKAGLLEYSEKEKKILKQGLAKAREEGTDVSALINFRLWNQIQNSTEEDRAFYKEMIKNYDGSYSFAVYGPSHNHVRTLSSHNGPTCFLLNPHSELHIKRVLKLTREYINMGYNSMFYDQPFEYFPAYNLDHEKASPDDVYEGVVFLLKEVKNHLIENDNQATVLGEECDIFASQYIDQWMSWYHDFEEVKRASYSVPYTMFSWVVDANISMANKAFASGLYLFISIHGMEKTLVDEPKFANHVKKLAALRKKTSLRTCHGIFRDQEGITVSSAENALDVQVFDSEEGPAVIFADSSGQNGKAHVQVRNSEGKGGEAEVIVDLDEFSPSKNGGMLYYLDGREEKVSGKGKLNIKLCPDEVVVWYV